MVINKEWHLAHKMPKNPTLEKRVKWHLEHVRHCDCRKLEGEMIEEFKKRFTGTHREFWIYFDKNDHKKLAEWAAQCAEHVLHFFEEESPDDQRPNEAIKTLREWIKTDKFSMSVIRGASLASHSAAREAKSEPARFAARAAGQAVATAHAPTHAFGSAMYAIKVVGSAYPGNAEKIKEEREWQMERVPEKLRAWVKEKMERIISK